MLLSLLPLAVALVAVGLAISWMLSHGMTLGVWILAGFLVAHGLVHLMFVSPAPASASAPGATEWPFDMAKSWLVTGPGLDVNLVRAVGLALIAAIVVTFALAGMATAGIVVPSGSWRTLVAISAVASIALLVLFFNPQLVLGLGIDAVLLAVVLASAWTPATAVS
jgi:hypothetical protein